MSRWQAIMVDLDGTLCDASHRVHHVQNKPKNWDAFYGAMDDDTIIPAVELLVYMARRAELKIVYLTGRPGTYRSATELWLMKHGMANDADLFMRSALDRRTDDIVKREIYHAEIEPRYDIKFVLEDRARVVKMWRGLGLACFQVADGDF